MITLEILKQILVYNAKTGILRWKVDRGGRVKARDIAGHIDKCGYIRIGISGKLYGGHNLAWVLSYGRLPIGVIDHIDRNRNNNRLNNLRDVSFSDNSKNRGGNKLTTFTDPSYRVNSSRRVDSGITSELVNTLLSYDEFSGSLTWKIDKSTRIKKGMLAGSIHDNGSVYIKINGRRYLAHRLVWLMFYGEFPSGHIDHINRNPGDNRLINLRAVSVSANNRNRSVLRNNTSGYTGVQLDKRMLKWRALIRVDGKIRYLGVFSTPEEASLVYEQFKGTLDE